MTAGCNSSAMFSALAVFSSKSRTHKGHSLLQTPCEKYILNLV